MAVGGQSGFRLHKGPKETSCLRSNEPNGRNACHLQHHYHRIRTCCSLTIRQIEKALTEMHQTARSGENESEYE